MRMRMRMQTKMRTVGVREALDAGPNLGESFTLVSSRGTLTVSPLARRVFLSTHWLGLRAPQVTDSRRRSIRAFTHHCHRPQTTHTHTHLDTHLPLLRSVTPAIMHVFRCLDDALHSLRQTLLDVHLSYPVLIKVIHTTCNPRSEGVGGWRWLAACRRRSAATCPWCRGQSSPHVTPRACAAPASATV